MMFRSVDYNKKTESRNYLVVGCTKNFYCHSSLIHPDDKWASLDEMPMHGGWATFDKRVQSGERTTDYVFSVGKDNPQTLPTPNNSGYKVIFLEYIPSGIYYEYDYSAQNKECEITNWNYKTQHFFQQCLADDGILIINNYRPSMFFAKLCGFTGDMLITSYGYVIIAKNAQTDLNFYLNHVDLNHIIIPNTVPTKKYSKELNILSERLQYKTLTYLYDICIEYKNIRLNRIFRNFFQDDHYKNTIDIIILHIRSILSNEETNPKEIIPRLKAFAQNNIDQKNFPNSILPRNTYTMNKLLETIIYFCDFVSQNLQVLSVDEMKKYSNYTAFNYR